MIAAALGFSALTAEAKSPRSLVQKGEGGRAGPCAVRGPIWAAFGWRSIDAMPLRSELMREPNQPHHRPILDRIQSILVACSVELEQEQVNRDPDRNVWRPELYVTARGFGAVAPSGAPVKIEMTFRRDRRLRDKLWLEAFSVSGDLRQGDAWRKTLERQWGPAPDTRYDPPGVRVFGNTYGDIYSSRPTDEIQVWGWLTYGLTRRGQRLGNYQTIVTCNKSRKICTLRVASGGSIPVWSPRFRQPRRR